MDESRRHAVPAAPANGAAVAAARTGAWPVARLLGWAALLVVVLRFFGPVTTVLLGVLGSGALAAAMVPLRDALPFRRGAGVLAGLVPPLGVAVVFGGIVWLAAANVQLEWESWRSVVQDVDARLREWSSSLGLREAPTVESMLGHAREWIGGGALASVASSLSGAFLAVVLVAFGTIYFLSEHTAEWSRRLVRWTFPERGEAVWSGLAELAAPLRHWVLGTLLSMAVIGVAAGVAFWLAGLRMPVTMGLVAGAAEIVPTLGPVAVFAIALAVAATQGGGVVLGVAIGYCAIQLLESYVLLPLVMKRAVRLPALVTLFTVVLWGKVLGMGGLLLAIPLDLLLLHVVPPLRRPLARDGAAA